MLAIDSTISVEEPGYGERLIRVHGGHHHAGVSHTTGVDLVTGERVQLPISTRWDTDTQRDVPVSATGWAWRPIAVAAAERAAGLPRGSLPARSDTTRTDLWADERMRNPAFIALLTLLTAHPEIVFYTVDWRDWVHHNAPRRHPRHADSPPLTAPRQASGLSNDRHLPYPLGGDGDMERYASYLCRLLSRASSPAVIQADQVVDTLADAVLIDLRDHYDDVVEWQRNPDEFRRLHRAPADLRVVRSLADIQSLAGWTPQVLAELEDLHDQARTRLVEQTAAYRPQGAALSLF